MRKLAFTLVLILMAGSLSAATLVLKGGKTLAVQGFSQQGNLIIVQLADGRAQSYPLTAVDMTATSAANPAAPAPEAEKDKGPRSPFAEAKASEGTGALTVTDKDVSHRYSDGDEAEDQDAGKDQGKGGGSPAQVVPKSYAKKSVGEGQWELTVILANIGGSPASGIGLTVRAVDAEGKDVGSAMGTSPDTIEGGQQTTVVVSMPAIGAAKTFGFDVSWQSITPTPSAKPGEAGKEPAAPPAPSPAPTPKITRHQLPPNTMLSPTSATQNPNFQAPLTAPPSAPPPAP